MTLVGATAIGLAWTRTICDWGGAWRTIVHRDDPTPLLLPTLLIWTVTVFGLGFRAPRPPLR
jgi:hypothetical protein